MKRETEEAWASERMENALLRERINDVAAQVARLAAALEGPDSPIEALLAETGRGLADAGTLDAPTIPEGWAGGGNLAYRIRALKTYASRVPHPDDPKRRN